MDGQTHKRVMLATERPKVAADNPEPDASRRQRQQAAACKPVSAARAVPEPYRAGDERTPRANARSMLRATLARRCRLACRQSTATPIFAISGTRSPDFKAFSGLEALPSRPRFLTPCTMAARRKKEKAR
jgi:hypothetical protein